MQLSKFTSNTNIIIFRIFLLLMSISSYIFLHGYRILNQQALSQDFINFTNWTNYAVMIWLILFFIWRNDAQKVSKLYGFPKGLLTMSMTIVGIVYFVLLSADHNPPGILAFTTLQHHYIIPILFVVDFLLTNQEEYSWKWLPYWLIYPIIYLIFGLFYGYATDVWVYFFINIPELGLGTFFMWFAVLLSLFSIFGALYIFISKKLNSKINKN